MKPVLLRSCLAAQTRRFIELRRLSGTDYKSSARLLEYFDRFLVEKKVVKLRISRRITDEYQQSLSRLAPRTRYNRFSVVRQLCMYLSRTDPLCYVPEAVRNISSRTSRRPYIYSHSEVRALLTAASELPPSDSLWPHTYRTLLGVLYSTGIRIGEAMALNLADFHEAEQRLYIAEGKFRKVRWVPLSTSTSKALLQYTRRRRRVVPRSPESPFFLDRRRRRLRHCTVNNTFQRLLRRCGIPHSQHARPCIHALRHTFAVSRLLVWYRDGKDVNARLPLLATYMGHVGPESSQVYLSATAELLDQVDRRFRSYYLNHVKPMEDDHEMYTDLA